MNPIVWVLWLPPGRKGMRYQSPGLHLVQPALLEQAKRLTGHQSCCGELPPILFSAISAYANGQSSIPNMAMLSWLFCTLTCRDLGISARIGACSSRHQYSFECCLCEPGQSASHPAVAVIERVAW